MKIIFLQDVKKDGNIIFTKRKQYTYEKEDSDYFYLKTEQGNLETIHKLSCNIMYWMVSDDIERDYD